MRAPPATKGPSVYSFGNGPPQWFRHTEVGLRTKAVMLLQAIVTWPDVYMLCRIGLQAPNTVNACIFPDKSSLKLNARSKIHVTFYKLWEDAPRQVNRCTKLLTQPFQRCAFNQGRQRIITLPFFYCCTKRLIKHKSLLFMLSYA